MTLIVFLVVINILIFVHEFGHFIAARRLGIKVEKFSLGFGKKLFGFKYKDIDFYFCLIPFGGYVKLAGDTREEFKNQSWEYLSKNPKDRAKVIFAGPLFNYILAFLFLWLVFCVGYPRMSPVVGDLVKDMPAKKAGIMKGDLISEINGVKIKYWPDVLENIRNAKSQPPFRITVERNKELLTFEINPIIKTQKDYFGKEHKINLIGIIPQGEIVYEKYNFFVAFEKSLFHLLEMTWVTLKSIFYLLIGYISFKEAVVGPVGIYEMTNAAVHYGVNAILHMIAMLSLALAIFNVLPIPVLDGGHLMFLAIESIRRRPLSAKTEQKIADIGFGFIIILAVFIFFNDLIKFGYLEKLNTVLKKVYNF